MPRMHFGPGPVSRPLRDPRDDLSHLARTFYDLYEPYCLRRLLADVEHLAIPEGREIREAIADALRLAERPPPAPRTLTRTPAPEGTRFAVTPLRSSEPVGEVVAGPGGSVDLAPLAGAIVAAGGGDAGHYEVWLQPISSPGSSASGTETASTSPGPTT